jgi:hypothetical protein
MDSEIVLSQYADRSAQYCNDRETQTDGGSGLLARHFPGFEVDDAGLIALSVSICEVRSLVPVTILRECRLDLVHLVDSNVDLIDALEAQVATETRPSGMSQETISARNVEFENSFRLPIGFCLFVVNPLRFLSSGDLVRGDVSSSSCLAEISACSRSLMESSCMSTRFSATSSILSRVCLDSSLSSC